MAHASLSEYALVDNSDFGRRHKVNVPPLPVDDEIHWQAGAHQGRFLKRFKALDRLAVNRLYDVAGLKTARRRRTVRLDPPDSGHVLNAAKGHKHSGKNHERQQKVGNWPSSHDRRPVAQRLPGKGHRAIDRRSRLTAVGNARDIRVAVELDVSAKRQRTYAPARAARINSRPQLGAEA